MGIKKLGHINRICFAMKKLKSRRRSQKNFVYSAPSTSTYFHSPDSGFSDYSTMTRECSSRSSLNTDGLKPRIMTMQQILSDSPALPRSVNGEILNIGSESDFRSPPPPAPSLINHPMNTSFITNQSGPLLSRDHQLNSERSLNLSFLPSRVSSSCSNNNSSTFSSYL